MTTTITTSTQQGDSRARRRKALIAAVCGGALLLGGSTFALWTQSTSFTGGSISTGKFDVATTTETAWDVSPNRDGSTSIGYTAGGVALKGHTVTDLSKFGMSPGDKIAIKFPLTVTLDGDNLVAGLTGDFSDFLGKGSTANDIVEVSAYVYDTDKTAPVKSVDLSSTGSVDLGYFASAKIGTAGNHDEDAGATPIRVGAGGTKAVDVLIVVSMSDTLEDEAARATTISLADAKFTLTQTRDDGVGDFVAAS